MEEDKKIKIKSHDKKANKNIVSDSDMDIKTVERTIKTTYRTDQTIEENDSEEEKENKVDTSSNFLDSDEDTDSEMAEETKKLKEDSVNEKQTEPAENKKDKDKKKTKKNDNGENQAGTEINSRKTSGKKSVFRKIAAVPLNIVKSSAKEVARKVNPFDKKINKNDVSDSGVESIRLAYTTSKKAVKTVERTVKTAQRTVKTTKNVVAGTGKMIYKTGKFAKKAVITTVKVTTTVVIHVAAALMNPAIVIIVFFMIVLIENLSAIVLLIGGGASAANSNQNAYSSAAGLGDVAEQYREAVEYFNTAVSNRQADFNALIDNMYYDYNNLTESSLAYMERTLPAPTVIYDKSFSTNDRKDTLKSAWDMSLTITEQEAIAIAYVYLEKKQNEANHTEGGIYPVSYTQEVFDEILTKCVIFSETVYSGQYCPDGNCTKVDNPDYAVAVANTNTSWNAYDEWFNIAEMIAAGWDWEYEISWRVSNWVLVYGLTPYYSNNGYDFADYLYQRYSDFWDIQASTPQFKFICEHRHDLHSVGLAFFTKEDIMNALEFTDNDKQWEELTEMGFENNPDISA